MSLKPGIYRIVSSDYPYPYPVDIELEEGFIEIYNHPEKGLCFYDQTLDEGDCHIPVGLLQCEIILLETY